MIIESVARAQHINVTDTQTQPRRITTATLAFVWEKLKTKLFK